MSKKVVIIGGGVIGFSCAYYCLRAGHDVTVVERGAPDRDCCSIGNAGMVVPSHFIPLAAPGMVEMGIRMMGDPESPFYIRPRLDFDLADWGMNFIRSATAEHVDASGPLLRDLQMASRGEFVRLAKEPGFEFGLKKNGLLMLCRTRHALSVEKHVAEDANQLGIPAELLTASETAKLDPDVEMDIEGSVYFPKDCHLRPEQFLQSLIHFVKSNGGSVLWNNAFQCWIQHADGTVSAECQSGVLDADYVVVAGGAYSPGLAKPLGLHLPMQAGKGYSLTVSKPIQLPKICSILTEARAAVTPMGNALRFGGTMEIAGLDTSINPQRIRGIIKAAPKYFPQFKSEHFEGIKPWAGLRPCSPDGLPYIGPTRTVKNLLIATGHAMLGLSLAPSTGQVISDLVSGRTPKFDLRLLSPGRYLGW
ncbi:MAG: FAD-dependent oxidoreductase [Verrucomicrobiales bacterium]|nr:FAD-dependent oxidoreductase [Verrucomicrobiales bacterium]